MATELSKQISAYDQMRDLLETDHFGKWAVFYNEQLVGTYETVESAVDTAVQKFGRGPYLIRQIGAPNRVTLPASIMYRPVHADI